MLCERRTLSKNLTLSYNNVIYQVVTKRAAYTMRVTPSKLVDAALARPTRAAKQKTYHPPLTHPWKYFDYSEKSMEAMEKRGDICILRK